MFPGGCGADRKDPYERLRMAASNKTWTPEEPEVVMAPYIAVEEVTAGDNYLTSCLGEFPFLLRALRNEDEIKL